MFFFKNIANIVDFPLEKLKNCEKMTNLSKHIFNGGHGEIIYIMLDVVTNVIQFEVFKKNFGPSSPKNKLKFEKYSSVGLSKLIKVPSN